MTTPKNPNAGNTPGKGRSYKKLSASTQASMREERITALEREHFGTVLAIEAADALPDGEEKQSRISSLNANLAIIEATLQKMDPA